jgi:hypothetical protein
MRSMQESRAATTTLEEAPEVVKQEKKETKKKKKKVQKEAVTLNKDDPLPGYENMENNGWCEGCVGDSVPCAVEINKLIAWRTGDSRVKAVCWRCKCKRKACDFGGDGSGAKGESEGEDVGDVSSAICHLEFEEEVRCSGGGGVAKDEEGEDRGVRGHRVGEED